MCKGTASSCPSGMVGWNNALAFRCAFRGRQLQDSNKDGATEFKYCKDFVFKKRFYEGNENYTEKLGYKGCYQYEPIEYRKQSVKWITKEASENMTEFIMKKLYRDDE